MAVPVFISFHADYCYLLFATACVRLYLADDLFEFLDLLLLIANLFLLIGNLLLLFFEGVDERNR